MLDYTQLHQVFPVALQSPYDRKTQHDIDGHRKSLDGVLFIDRVLKALGISKAKAYPPKTDNALKQYHQQVCDANIAIHHKLSLFYYILLDYDLSNDLPSVSESFAMVSGIPKNYQLFMNGLWYMDREEYSRALEYLGHPSLGPDFADDIVSTLVRQSPKDDYSLALSYFYSVRPILKTNEALELLFDAMVRTNATEALLFSRTFPHHTRELLFHQLAGTAFSSGRGDEISNQASELLFFPFDKEEDHWLEEFLSSGDGRNLKRAKDMLLARRIACDKFEEVGKYRANSQWAAVLDGIKGGTEGYGSQ